MDFISSEHFSIQQSAATEIRMCDTNAASSHLLRLAGGSSAPPRPFPTAYLASLTAPAPTLHPDPRPKALRFPNVACFPLGLCPCSSHWQKSIPAGKMLSLTLSCLSIKTASLLCSSCLGRQNWYRLSEQPLSLTVISRQINVLCICFPC